MEAPTETPGRYRSGKWRWIREEFQDGGPKARSLTCPSGKMQRKQLRVSGPWEAQKGTAWCTRGDLGPEEETTWDLGTRTHYQSGRPRDPTATLSLGTLTGPGLPPVVHGVSNARTGGQLEPPADWTPWPQTPSGEGRRKDPCKSRSPERGSALTCMLQSSFIGKISVSAITGLEAGRRDESSYRQQSKLHFPAHLHSPSLGLKGRWNVGDETCHMNLSSWPSGTFLVACS